MDSSETPPRNRYRAAFVLFVILVPAIAYPLHLLQWNLLEKSIFYGDAGLRMPTHEAIAASVLLAPMTLLNRFFLESARSYFQSDDGEILLFWSRIVAVFWALPLSVLAAWIGIGVRRTNASGRR